MADYSQSPARRAQGYLTAMIEWGYFTYVYAEQQYARIRLQYPHEVAKDLSPIAVLTPTVTSEQETEFLLWRLCLGTPFASFCRGYLFALVEQCRYSAEGAEIVMRMIAERKGLEDHWLAGYPRLQSHPLHPHGPKIEADGALRQVGFRPRHA